MTPDCTIIARSPADLIAVTPYLLGFHPADSLVAIGVTGDRITFAMRHDLPPPGVDLSDVARVIRQQDLKAVCLIGYGPATPVFAAMISLMRPLTRLGVPIFEALRITDGRWWSIFCRDRRCCPSGGKPCPSPGSTPAAQAVLRGEVALPDREALVAQVGAVTGAARTAMTAATKRARARLTDLYGADVLAGARGRTVRRAGRLAVRSAERRYRAGDPLDDDEVAWLSVLLVDGTTLDYALDRSGSEQWRIGLWTEVTRRAESDCVASAACLLAYAAWQAGRGALARVAVDRALHEDARHHLARLLDGVLAAGLGPDAVSALRPPAARTGLGALVHPGGRGPVSDAPPGRRNAAQIGNRERARTTRRRSS